MKAPLAKAARKRRFFIGRSLQKMGLFQKEGFRGILSKVLVDVGYSRGDFVGGSITISQVPQP
ncbi:hypothetical protein KKC1_17100 [Calderihabitans maritimus]|uniref:Uncharacterized protein n=1 Tax=Calderihabitans maritimus TaxID=1246530 RepID=A0A1Z5HSP9_9FIRM|nr:hypothetical protein KKC1_17100 [Calderihabitans maritimus]